MAKLERVEGHVERPADCSQRMRQRLQAAQATTSQVLKITEQLQKKEVTAESQKEVVQAFLTRFRLQPNEMAVLNSGDISGQPFSLGPAHGLFVSAFFFSLIAIGLYVAGFILAPKYGWVGNNPYGAGGGSDDDEARCRSCRSKLAVCVCKDKEARRTSVTTSETNSAFIPNVESEGC